MSKPYASGQTAPRLKPVPSYRQQIDLQLKYFFLHTTSAGAISQWSDVFALNSVTNFAKYTALYDEFRVNVIEVNIVPQQQAGNEVGVYISAVDVNDNAVVAIADLEAQNNSIETNVLVPHYHRWVPTVYSGVTTVNGWLPNTNAATIWYGLKTDAGITTAAEQLTFFVTLHVSFRGQQA
jgi:hypothetical protein